MTMKLKTLRESAGLSQEQLGRKLAAALDEANPPKYCQPRIAAYERGRNNLSLPVAKALVTILNRELAKAKSRKRAALDDLL